jgi:hypothetical protein
MKKILGPVLLVILVLGVGAAIVMTAGNVLKARQAVTVRGLIGSEKEPFFQDERVLDALREGGLIVEVEKAGSREIATQYDLTEYDFAWPAGVPAAEKMRRDQSGSQSYDVFFSPMTIASWKPIAGILVANGVAEDRGGSSPLDMEAFLALAEADRRWSDLEGNGAYDVNKSVLINSTDVRSSNSAAMYLSLASFVANGNNVVRNEAEAQAIMPLMESLFLEQGFQAGSSQAPFQDYLVMGMGKTPLVMIYEAQFIAAAAEGTLGPDMVLIYPEPTIFSKHVMVTFTEGGAKLGELLQTDPELQRLAVEHGFRTNDVAYFRDFVGKHNLATPDSIVNVIEPPSYEVLESMIQQIENEF